jgi:hypothetical protein
LMGRLGATPLLSFPFPRGKGLGVRLSREGKTPEKQNASRHTTSMHLSTKVELKD